MKREWLCFECEQPLESCFCNNRVWQNLIVGVMRIKNPRQRRRALKALIALMVRYDVAERLPTATIDFGADGRRLATPRNTMGPKPGRAAPGMGGRRIPKKPPE